MTEKELLKIEAIIGEFAAQVFSSRKWQLEQLALGIQMQPTFVTAAQLLRSGDAQEWLTMAKAAVGLIERTDENAAYVHEICQGMAEWLFAIPGMSTYEIPGVWAQHPVGALWWGAIIWVQGDALITIKEAAEIAGVSLPAISQNKSLDFFIDPESPQQQGRRKVRRSQVVAMYGNK